MLLIVSITPLIAASAVPPCLIAAINIFSKFGALEERSYYKIIWLQILKTLREEKNAVRELSRCDERVHMFQCLVMYISRDKIYFHPQARYILLSHRIGRRKPNSKNICNLLTVIIAGGGLGRTSRKLVCCNDFMLQMNSHPRRKSSADLCSTQ
jgi:hypothetical protein